jgi:hypothetical protein
MVEERLREFREILMRQHPRGHPACYSVNRAIETYNDESNNGKNWKVPSVHRSLRRALKEEERDRLMSIAAELRIEVVSHRLKYYVNNL